MATQRIAIAGGGFATVGPGTVSAAGLMAALLSACVASGVMEGRLIEPGERPVAFQLTYRSERFGLGGEMKAVLPDGERFSGRYLQITSTTAAEDTAALHGGWWGWSSWGPLYGDVAGGDPWNYDPGFSPFVENYTKKVVARLSGDRGETIYCRFRLNNAEQGMEDGGTGRCKLSHGAEIEVKF